MVTSEQIRAARALLHWEQSTLAQGSGLPLATIKRIEGRPGEVVADEPTIDAIIAILRLAGLSLRDEGAIFRPKGVGDRVGYRPSIPASVTVKPGEIGVVFDVEIPPNVETGNPKIRVRFRDHETPWVPQGLFQFEDLVQRGITSAAEEIKLLTELGHPPARRPRKRE